MTACKSVVVKGPGMEGGGLAAEGNVLDLDSGLYMNVCICKNSPNYAWKLANLLYVNYSTVRLREKQEEKTLKALGSCCQQTTSGQLQA